jgi:hypothetical protein
MNHNYLYISWEIRFRPLIQIGWTRTIAIKMTRNLMEISLLDNKKANSLGIKTITAGTTCRCSVISTTTRTMSTIIHNTFMITFSLIKKNLYLLIQYFVRLFRKPFMIKQKWCHLWTLKVILEKCISLQIFN